LRKRGAIVSIVHCCVLSTSFPSRYAFHRGDDATFFLIFLIFQCRDVLVLLMPAMTQPRPARTCVNTTSLASHLTFLVSSCFRHVRTRAPSLAKFRVPSYLGLGTRIHRTDEITHRSNKSKMHQFRTLSCKPLDCVCHFALRDIKVDCSFGPGRMN
jgi:hypothetical protein